MHRVIALTVMLVAFVPPLQAEDFLNWLDAVGSQYSDKGVIEGDRAELITLEKRESEMYPKVSPDGKYFLAVSSKSRQHRITRRLLENGDPINIVSESDPQALDSIAWYGNEAVTFLSFRADSPGLWKKPVSGGVTRRLNGRLDGELRSPIVLEDESLIAVRLHSSSRLVAPKSAKEKSYKLAFDNWQSKGKQPHLIKISKEGVESELASGVNPSLSPDGKRLVFSMQAGRSWHLFMMNVDGSGLMQLSEGRSIDVQPTWSPDGKWVAFTSNRGDADMRHSQKGNWDIWMIAHDGRHLTRLTTDEARDGAPSFANNGRIYFHSDRKVSKQDLDGHQLHSATKGFHIWSVMLPAMAN